MIGLFPCVTLFVPRRRIVPPAPGCPEFCSTVTPGARAVMMSCVLFTGAAWISRVEIIAGALPTSFFRALAAVVAVTAASVGSAGGGPMHGLKSAGNRGIRHDESG